MKTEWGHTWSVDTDNDIDLDIGDDHQIYLVISDLEQMIEAIKLKINPPTAEKE